MAYTHDDPKKKAKVRDGSKLKQNNTEPGQHKITVFEVTKVDWSKKELMVNEQVDAVIETVGFPAGTAVTFSFFEASGQGLDRNFGTVTAKISGDKATVSWKYPLDKIKKEFVQNASPSIYFKASVKAKKEVKSPLLPVIADMQVKVETEAGKPISGVEVVVKQSNGKVTNEKTDGAGTAKLNKLPACAHQVKFPSSSRIVAPGEVVTDFTSVPSFKTIFVTATNVHTFRLLELFVYCSHKIDQKRRVVGNVNVFEVVPDTNGTDAYKDDVMILSRTATSLTCNGKSLEKKGDEYGMHAFELKSAQDFQVVPNIFSPDFWSGLKNPKSYTISGLPAPLTVKCYRPDIYKLQVKFPAMRKSAGGYKEETEASSAANAIKNRRSVAFAHFEEHKEKEGWHLNKWPKPITSEAPLTLMRNDAKINLKFLETVGAVVELANKINLVLTCIQKNVPKVGWYFEWDNQFMQGTFIVEWGWKEYKDHRAFYYVGVNIDIRLVEFNMEIGIGISSVSYKVQVYGAIKGGVSISAKVSRYSPDGKYGLEIPFSADIVGSLGARAQAGCFVKLEGTCETGIKLADGALKFNQDDGIAIECAIKWTGIKGAFSVSVGTAKKKGTEETEDFGNDPGEMDSKTEQSFEKELIGSKELGKWEWSSKKKADYNPPIMPREDLKKLLHKKITEGDNIRVKTISVLGINKYMPTETMVKELEDVIHARNDIKKDPASMEAMVFKIRNDLQVLILENQKWNHLANMEQSRWYQYINGKELKNILNNNIDPLQEIINKNP